MFGKFLLALSFPLIASLAAPRLDFNRGIPRIQTQGTQGNVLTLEAKDQLQTRDWDVLGSVMLTNTSNAMLDVWCGGKPQRFYRLTESAPGDLPRAENFRLLDHTGKSHELYYYSPATNVNAIVLIFSANGCQDLTTRLPAIEALRTKFSARGVKFWMVDSNPSDTRASIAVEATRQKINMPILHDRAQTVARLYNSSKAGEVVCISRDGMGVFYRGALDDAEVSPTGSATRALADEALTAFLSGSTPQVMALKAAGCEITNAPAADISYSSVIAPILQKNCVSCHSPGNIAPWSMTNHAIVQAYAPLIRMKVSSKEMPPWHADPEYGRFANDKSLPPAEEKALLEWTLAGAPRGSGVDPLLNVPPPPPKWPAELGEPDLIVRTPVQTIKATGVEPYRYIVVNTGLTEDKWLRAAIVKPTNRKVVHHYLVWEGTNMTQMAYGVAGYVPGTQESAFPEGTGVLLSGEGSVVFNLHYTPNGEETTDQPEMALWFHKTAPAKALVTLPLPNLTLNIPAGAEDHAVSAKMPKEFPIIPARIKLYGMAPHMHVRGKHMKFEVVYPNGQRETLLSVPKYDFHWQTRYMLAEPKIIPAGSKVELVGGFDNSALNMMNPDPSTVVHWGEQSWEEMFIGYFTFTFEF